MTGRDPLLGELVGALGEASVLGGAATDQFSVDWTGRYRGRACAVVLPADVTELRRAVEVLVRNGAPYVIQGGGTGLVGGSTPSDGEVVLSMRRFDSTITVDRERREATAGAGATLRSLQQEAARVGLDYPVDIGSRGEAMVGGTIATNAAGLRTVRHGRTERRVIGLEAVAADGSLIEELGGLTERSAAFIGGEGIFGVVTRARLRLELAPQALCTALVAVADLAAAVSLADRAKEGLSGIEAFEFIDSETAEFVADEEGSHPPLAGKVLVLVEVSGATACRGEMEAFLGSSPEARTWELSSDQVGRAALWHWRETVPEAISRAGIPHKFDISIDPRRSEAVLASLRRKMSATKGVRMFSFGHLAEGRLHVNVLGVAPKDASFGAEVHSIIAVAGGGVVSEHGVGRAKAFEFVRACDPEWLATLVDRKLRFDPQLLANRGVLLPSQLFVDPSK